MDPVEWRPLFTTADAYAAGLTHTALRWGEATGKWRRVVRGVYADGHDDPTPLDVARARVLSAGSVAAGRLAGVLLGLDGVTLDGEQRRQRTAPPVGAIIGGVPCTGPCRTLTDLSALLDDDRWEQALESALRKRLTSIGEIDDAVREMAAGRRPGVTRVRRVLGRRPAGAPPTESLLETLMVQLARRTDGVPEPTRQHVVLDPAGDFVARVDLCWPEVGVFVELDGQHHKGQPVYDARRQTAVVAATGWLTARFTWHEVVHVPRTSGRRLAEVIAQARRRVVTASTESL